MYLVLADDNTLHAFGDNQSGGVGDPTYASGGGSYRFTFGAVLQTGASSLLGKTIGSVYSGNTMCAVLAKGKTK